MCLFPVVSYRSPGRRVPPCAGRRTLFQKERTWFLKAMAAAIRATMLVEFCMICSSSMPKPARVCSDRTKASAIGEVVGGMQGRAINKGCTQPRCGRGRVAPCRCSAGFGSVDDAVSAASSWATTAGSTAAIVASLSTLAAANRTRLYVSQMLRDAGGSRSAAKRLCCYIPLGQRPRLTLVHLASDCTSGVRGRSILLFQPHQSWALFTQTPPQATSA